MELLAEKRLPVQPPPTTLLPKPAPFANYRCFSCPLLVPVPDACGAFLPLPVLTQCPRWSGPGGGGQLRASWGGSVPCSSDAEWRHCPWAGERAVAQGTALQRPRAQTSAYFDLTGCSCQQCPSELWETEGKSLHVLDQSFVAWSSGQGQAGHLHHTNYSANGVKLQKTPA